MAKLSEIFLKNLKEAVESSSLTQAQIARRADTDPNQLSRYLKGKSSPSLDVMERLAEALGKDIRQLLDDKSSIRRRAPVPEALRTISALIDALDEGDKDSPELQELFAFVREASTRVRGGRGEK